MYFSYTNTICNIIQNVVCMVVVLGSLMCSSYYIYCIIRLDSLLFICTVGSKLKLK